MVAVVRGRPRKFAEFDAFYADLPKVMDKRPRYLNGVGVFRGAKGDSAWVKLNLPNGAAFDGKSYPPGGSIEIKLGRLTSWPWEALVAKHAELQGKADRSEPLQARAVVTFKQWSDTWLERKKESAKAYETLEIHVRVHLLPVFGSKALGTITVSDVNEWITGQLAAAAPGTVKRQFSTLRAILNSAVRAGHISINPCGHAETIRGVQGRQRFLDGKELGKLLKIARAENEWLADYILWCIHSGMRKSEIRRLTWQDVRVLDAKQTVIQIPITKADQPRWITATATMSSILKRQKRCRVAGDNRVFPVSAMTLRRKWEQARKSAELGDVTLHDLRRTHSTHAAAAGVDLRTLADRLGHADLSMLQKHYAAVVGSSATEAANTIQKTFDRLMK